MHKGLILITRQLFKSCIWLITYCILLVAALIKIDIVTSFISKIFLILSPLFIGIAIAFVLNRPYKFFKRIFIKRLKDKPKAANSFAIAASYILLFGVVASIFAYIIPQLADSVSLLSSNIGDYSARLQTFTQKASDYLKLDSFNSSVIQDNLSKLPQAVSGFITGVFPHIFSFTSTVVRSVANIVLGIIFSAYLLLDKEHLMFTISGMLKTYMPKKYPKIKYIYDLSNKAFSSFVAGQFAESLILGVLCFLGMLIFRFEYALLISVIIAVTGLIPIVGAVIGCIPSVFILLMINPVHALWFLVFIIVLQQLEGNLIYPKVVGESIGLPAMWVLLAIIVGGGMFGIVGMLLGVPVTSVLYQLVKGDMYQRQAQEKADKLAADNKNDQERQMPQG